MGLIFFLGSAHIKYMEWVTLNNTISVRRLFFPGFFSVFILVLGMGAKYIWRWDYSLIGRWCSGRLVDRDALLQSRMGEVSL